MARVNIRKFDPSKMRSNSIVLLLGKRGTGKSTLLKDLMFHMRNKLDFGLAMSPTEECTSDLAAYMPSSCIYGNFSSDKVETLLEEQRRAVRRGSSRQVFLLLDDCMYDKKVLKGTNIRNLFMNGRHRNIFFISCQQYVTDMPPELRGQVDYVFALREPIIANKERLWKFFFGMFSSLQDFTQVMDRCTQNFDCLVFDATSKSTAVEDCVFWYRADLHGDFQVGNPSYLRYHREYHRETDLPDEEGGGGPPGKGKLLVQKVGH
jgi:hypothetical protein